MLKAILYDLDGVLVDAVELHEDAFLEALGAYGFNITKEDHRANLNGLPTKTKLEELQIPEELRQDIQNEKDRLTSVKVEEHIKPDREKAEMLRYLKGNGLLLACCSNATTPSVINMLKHANIHQYFHLILGNTDVDKPKPDPEIYFQAMNRLRVKPEECLIFEDSERGLEAARQTGARYFQVEYLKVNKGLVRLFV